MVAEYMADVHDKATRSYNMSRIRSKNTKPEMIVRKFLFSKGFRYRLHVKALPGTPDLVFPKYKTIVFIHGCFWHGHEGCKYFVVPGTRTKWWMDKISRTKELDRQNCNELKRLGWKIIMVFECELKPVNKEMTLRSLKRKLSI